MDIFNRDFMSSRPRGKSILWSDDSRQLAGLARLDKGDLRRNCHLTAPTHQENLWVEGRFHVSSEWQSATSLEHQGGQAIPGEGRKS